MGYVSISVQRMEDRLVIAENNAYLEVTPADYIATYGGPSCSYGNRYLPRYSTGVKLNAWLTELVKHER